MLADPDRIQETHECSHFYGAADTDRILDVTIEFSMYEKHLPSPSVRWTWRGIVNAMAVRALGKVQATPLSLVSGDSDHRNIENGPFRLALRFFTIRILFVPITSSNLFRNAHRSFSILHNVKSLGLLFRFDYD